MRESLVVGAVLAVVLLIICISPMLILWALNTLFEQAGVAMYIPHNIWTYLAVLVIGGPLNGTQKAAK